VAHLVSSYGGELKFAQYRRDVGFDRLVEIVRSLATSLYVYRGDEAQYLLFPGES